jgi:hypothetical protein
MRTLFRVNLSKSLSNFLEHGYVTCPTGGHGGWARMSRVKKGDIVLIGDGIINITHICMAESDPVSGFVNFFYEKPCLSEEPLTLLKLKIVHDYSKDPLKVSYLNSLLESSTLSSMNFCVEVGVKEEFSKAIIQFLNSWGKV